MILISNNYIQIVGRGKIRHDIWMFLLMHKALEDFHMCRNVIQVVLICLIKIKFSVTYVQ